MSDAPVPREGTVAGLQRSGGGVPFADPCRTIAGSFLQRIARISEKSNSGWSRVYVRVLREGGDRDG